MQRGAGGASGGVKTFDASGKGGNIISFFGDERKRGLGWGFVSLHP